MLAPASWQEASVTSRTKALLAFAALALAPATARAQEPPHQGGGCLYLNQIQNQRIADDRTVLFRVGSKEVWRLGFSQRCPELTSPGAFLILKPFGGMGLVCHAIDLDVKVSQAPPAGFAVPCIPGELHRLTPEELAATPKDKLP
jgi:hypothetical protein